MLAQRVDLRKLKPEKKLSFLKKAAQILAAGDLVIYPTDTAYALGANALDEAAVAKVFQLKQRPRHKALSVLVSSVAMAKKYTQWNARAQELAQRFLPGPLTLVVAQKTKLFPSLLTAGGATIGLRIPAAKTALTLAEIAGFPITATSVNISGEQPCYNLEQLAAVFQRAPVKMILDQGALPPILPSTIVDVTQQPPRILRQGPIKAAELGLD